ncbi:MAG: outer membrane beta-barrel protein [Bacteriovoracaceae bacterium]|nr:outer membrane beta-barrel protein [Bacteriovoracaceae bacterium]
MNKKLSTVLLGTLMAGSSVFAADSDVKVTANFDINYLYNKSLRLDTSTSNGTIPGISKSNQANELNVSEVYVGFGGTVKNLDWYVEANLGGEGAANTSGVATQYINRAWLSHNVNEMLAISAGRLSTNVTNESYMSKDNWNYTRSFLFQTVADWGNGVAAKYDMKNGFAVSVAVLDRPESNENTTTTESKSQLVQASFSRDKLVAELNYLISKSVMGVKNPSDETFTHIDLNAKYEINHNFSVGLIYAMGSGDVAVKGTESKYSDIAVLAKFKATDNFWASARFEQFKEEVDAGGTFFFSKVSTSSAFSAANGNDNTFTSSTLTVAYDFMNGSEIRLEGRMDKSDDNVYTDKDGNADDSNTTIAAAWLFRI